MSKDHFTKTGAYRDFSEALAKQQEEVLAWTVGQHTEKWRFWLWYRASNSPCESPAEALLDLWFGAVYEWHQPEDDATFGFKLAPQVELQAGGNTYRLDFALAPNDPDWPDKGEARGVHYPKVAVEIDGHDFHERTKEQVTYRNQRDRDLQNAGWRVLHFSGSELFRNPAKVAEDVYFTLHKAHSQFVFAYSDAVDAEGAD